MADFPMPDPAEQLQRLHEAGFQIRTFERYPRAVGVQRGSIIALFEPTSEGLRMIGRPGWRMGELMGVLVKKEGREVFQAKTEILEATPERLAELGRFEVEVEVIVGREPGAGQEG